MCTGSSLNSKRWQQQGEITKAHCQIWGRTMKDEWGCLHAVQAPGLSFRMGQPQISQLDCWPPNHRQWLGQQDVCALHNTSTLRLLACKLLRCLGLPYMLADIYCIRIHIHRQCKDLQELLAASCSTRQGMMHQTAADAADVETAQCLQSAHSGGLEALLVDNSP